MRTHRDDTGAQTVAELRDELQSLAGNVAKLITASGEDERGSWTLKEWMRRHDLSPSQAYKLFRENRGPELMLVGSVGKRVSRQADNNWVRSREAEARARREAGGATPAQRGEPSPPRPVK